MSKKHRFDPFKSGQNAIEFAKERGASIEEKKTFTKISTPKGSVYINPGREDLDKYTQSNLKRWFRLLGLMLFLLLCVYPIFIRMV